VDRLQLVAAPPADLARGPRRRLHDSNVAAVAAINDADAGAYPDPRFLEKLALVATPVTIDRGQIKTQDLSTVSVK
jgi:hypothetical protein